MSGELVDEHNIRWGGHSEVRKVTCSGPDQKTTTFYVKKQVNQRRRTALSRFRAKTTYWVERYFLECYPPLSGHTPECIFFGEQTMKKTTRAVLVVKDLAGLTSLECWLGKPGGRSTWELQQAATRLAEFLLPLHRQGFEHGTLYPKHIFFTPDLSHFSLIDLEKSRLRRSCTRAARQDLRRLARSLEGSGFPFQRLLSSYRNNPAFSNLKIEGHFA
ncbi:MAG: lipopolysaccharide kinase InaA family protein [Alcanivoracaceae bacterium]|nr:lipopolysaccharide kinase InaA family protein [Alcanivoracaceae bacterium]